MRRAVIAMRIFLCTKLFINLVNKGRIDKFADEFAKGRRKPK
jgi:hypothetical protein